jgi:hypothetical protein
MGESYPKVLSDPTVGNRRCCRNLTLHGVVKVIELGAM